MQQLKRVRRPGRIYRDETLETVVALLELTTEQLVGRIEQRSPTSSWAAAFRTFGFGVLRQFFDPRPLAAEIDRVMQDGLVSHVSRTEEIHFQYVPMMTAQTAASLSLLDRIETVAVDLLGGSVLPTRAKGVRYSGNTPWHPDSISSLASVGFLAYLEPLGGEDGALQVLPGSHHPEFRDALRRLGLDSTADLAVPAHVVTTQPGDIIVLDEHLFHASFGGRTRRQWRIDFVKAPESEEEENLTKSYFAALYPPDWDGGYDVDRYPSYGPDWRGSSRPAVAQLETLGVYELAAAQEEFTRSRALLP
ncbi:MAG TPA: phytanoyl-CoA dioxygenase family protein [Blastocatellia bacterium]|nr:phytanoyl-CoA dioxygenase family protein [Blastocatellia bacterium]